MIDEEVVLNSFIIILTILVVIVGFNIISDLLKYNKISIINNCITINEKIYCEVENEK